MNLGWRALAKRQWPLAGALVFIVVLEIGSWDRYSGPQQLPGVLTLCVLAVLAPRRPFDAALASAAALLASSAFLRFIDSAAEPAMFYGGAVASETAAAMAIIAIVIRQADVWRAAIGATSVVAAMVAAEYIRPSYYEKVPTTIAERSDFLFGAVVLLVLAVGTGLYFRMRDRERARDVELEVAAAQNAWRSRASCTTWSPTT